MELSRLQTEILNAPYSKVVVTSAAGSGKTRLLTEKVRQILRAGYDPHGIAVITFTNMAAAELKGRLGDDYKDGMFIGTIHGLANYMLSVGGVNTQKVLDEEEFDKLFSMIIKNPHVVKHLDWVLLDEAQDSDPAQFKFLFEMINPEYFFVIGDIRQSIYRWRGATPAQVMMLTRRPDVKTFDMNENYRNDSNILAYAKSLIQPTGEFDTSISMTNERGSVIEMGFDVNNICEKILTSHKPFGSWAILTRTNQEISSFTNALRRYAIPFDTFKQGDLSKEELNEKMEQDTVKLLTVHSAKGLEWDNVVALGMRYYNVEERCICYVAATRARHQLIWIKRTYKKKRA